MSIEDIAVPDLGVDEGAVVEILVKLGDKVSEGDSILAIETDKATAELPAPFTGIISELLCKINDMVSTGTIVAKIETASSASAAAEKSSPPAASPEQGGSSPLQDVLVPDLGVDEGAVVEILVKLGDRVSEGDSILAIETDKATAELPAPFTGIISELLCKINDMVSTGTLVAKIASIASGEESKEKSPPPKMTSPPEPKAEPNPEPNPEPKAEPKASQETLAIPTNKQHLGAKSHASPAVRQLARQLGVQISELSGTGPKNRILFSDVKQFVKAIVQAESSSAVRHSRVLAPVDFSKFGSIEELELSKIKQVTGQHLAGSWPNIPLVTHFEEANIDSLEKFRQELNARKGADNPKATPLSFIVKAIVSTLQKFPAFNSSLDPSGKKIILKKYYNIGLAVDTPKGLLVPVIKDAGQKSIDEISASIIDLGSRGRAGRLNAADMAGGSFTISSLGGLGGTNFTPLVNAPEVAILGVARSMLKATWTGAEFKPSLVLPFSLSYDHRVIDGGEAARFCSHLAKTLEDLRYIIV